MTASPPVPRLEIVDHAAASTTVLRVHEPMFAYAAANALSVTLAAAVDERIARGVRSFVIDLSVVKALDSVGLAALLRVRRRAVDAGGTVALIVLSSRLRRVLAKTGLERLFRLAVTEKQGMALVSGAPTESAEA